MDSYIPPFEITNDIMNRISSIMKKMGSLNNYNEFDKMPVLRKNNRIKSIHSSLSIESNSLTIEQIEDVIDGELVIGPKNEIQEVKNAYNAYLKIEQLDPYSIDDLKKIHGTMTYLTVKDSGEFRKGNEGVFDENGNCIHICPPPDKVNELMKQLFDWMKDNKDVIHPLILSSIFHYEFVFIHPFSDGNGRVARLWQNAILYNWESMFLYIPIESQIKKYQDEYYKTIYNCNIDGDSTLFIEFMLKMIDEVIDEMLLSSINLNNLSKYEKKLLNAMEKNKLYTTNELLELVNMKSRSSFRKNYLVPAINKGLIKMSFEDEITSKNQTYYKNWK